MVIVSIRVRSILRRVNYNRLPPGKETPALSAAELISLDERKPPSDLSERSAHDLCIRRQHGSDARSL